LWAFVLIGGTFLTLKLGQRRSVKSEAHNFLPFRACASLRVLIVNRWRSTGQTLRLVLSRCLATRTSNAAEKKFKSGSGILRETRWTNTFGF